MAPIHTNFSFAKSTLKNYIALTISCQVWREALSHGGVYYAERYLLAALDTAAFYPQLIVIPHAEE